MVSRISFQHGDGGDGRIDITLTDLRGVIRAHPARPADDPADLPDALPMALTAAIIDWFDKRPHQRLLCVVPIVWEGYTVALHAWYAPQETADAKMVDLRDHRLTDDDFAEFERGMKSMGAQLTAHLKKSKSPQGTSYTYLSQIRLTYPPSRQKEAEVLWCSYGFEPGK